MLETIHCLLPFQENTNHVTSPEAMHADSPAYLTLPFALLLPIILPQHTQPSSIPVYDIYCTCKVLINNQKALSDGATVAYRLVSSVIPSAIPGRGVPSFCFLISRI
jgi:hypothetical protein